jgi:hypothetical protein
MLRLKALGSIDAVVDVDLESAISQCGLFADLADDLLSEASDAGTVTVDVPTSARGISALETFIALGNGAPAPLDGSHWADGEAASRFGNIVKSLIGQTEEMGDGGVEAVLEAMCAADFVRHDACLGFWANYLAHRLSSAAPVEVKRWCGRDHALTLTEQESITAMHRLLLEQKL